MPQGNSDVLLPSGGRVNKLGCFTNIHPHNWASLSGWKGGLAHGVGGKQRQSTCAKHVVLCKHGHTVLLQLEGRLLDSLHFLYTRALLKSR